MKDRVSRRPLIPVRHLMVTGTFLLATLVLVDRIVISVAKDGITESLQISDKQFGWALSLFALGYALFQAPIGLLADRLGARLILTIVVSFWSLFTALTGLVYQYVALLVVRFLFGMGEAGAFPGIAKAVVNWIPVGRRGLVNGINFSGGRFGAAFALPVMAYIIDLFGWRMTFVALGAVGIAWAVCWYLFFRDNPLDHPWLSQQERQAAKDAQQEPAQPTAKKSLPLSGLFRSTNMWLAMGQYFASNFTFFFCLTWLFPHLKERFMLDSVEAGLYASLPVIAGAFGNMSSGWWVDHLFRKTTLKWSRAVPAMAGFALAAAGLLASLAFDQVDAAVLCLSVAVFGADMTLSPSWTFCADIGKSYAATVSGTMNMAGNLGSFFTALAFPYLQDWTGSEVPFFIIGAALNITAIVLWLKMNPHQTIRTT